MNNQVLIEKIAQKRDPDRKDIVFLLNLEKESDKKFLFNLAREIAKENFSSEIPVFGTFEFSNYCEENCVYCNLREENFSLERYRFPADKVIETVKKVSNLGLNKMILESGQDSIYDTDIISYILFSIKQYSQDIGIYLSIGERGFDEYKTWKYSGVEGYFLSHDTSNRELFRSTNHRRSLDKRIRHLQYLKRIGLETGTGIIVGLPEQTVSDIADDIILSKELAADYLLIQPFIPHPFTPYQHRKAGNPEMTLKSIAAARIVLKNVFLPFKIGIIQSNLLFDKVRETGINILLAQVLLVPHSSKFIPGNKETELQSSESDSKSNLSSPIRIFENSISSSQI